MVPDRLEIATSVATASPSEDSNAETSTCEDETEGFLIQSPRSMHCPADFGTFMVQQENLQQLLLDIHEDGMGFKDHVEGRREDLAQVKAGPLCSVETDIGSLDEYAALREVGKGRFSTVYYAERKSDATPCAIKKIKLDVVTEKKKGSKEGSEMNYEKCLQEVGLLKQLSCDNIVTLHSCFIDKNILWIVLEWVDGGDLKGIISYMRRNKRRFDELAVWSYFTQICDALTHMHSKRIMHRDLKPANILVCSDGRIKLGDLGLGRYLNKNSVCAFSQVGTPLYMSPEVLRGDGHDFHSDIWSLGCVLYELAMLASPFAESGLTLERLFVRIVRGTYPPVDTQCYSHRLANLVDNLLVVDPWQRPDVGRVASAAHIAEAAELEGANVTSCQSNVVMVTRDDPAALAQDRASMVMAPPAPRQPKRQQGIMIPHQAQGAGLEASTAVCSPPVAPRGAYDLSRVPNQVPDSCSTCKTEAPSEPTSVVGKKREIDELGLSNSFRNLGIRLKG
ncbi:unnamed protein product, partial [Chrysoparadoxa australica]